MDLIGNFDEGFFGPIEYESSRTRVRELLQTKHSTTTMMTATMTMTITTSTCTEQQTP